MTDFVLLPVSAGTSFVLFLPGEWLWAHLCYRKVPSGS